MQIKLVINYLVGAKMFGIINMLVSKFNLYSDYHYILNEKIKDIAKNKTSIMGELSIRYNFKKIYIQPVVAFGRFVNTNFSVQYEF